MQCDFYECADLIDELDKLQTEAEEKRIRNNKIDSKCYTCTRGCVVSVLNFYIH